MENVKRIIGILIEHEDRLEAVEGRGLADDAALAIEIRKYRARNNRLAALEPIRPEIEAAVKAHAEKIAKESEATLAAGYRQDLQRRAKIEAEFRRLAEIQVGDGEPN